MATINGIQYSANKLNGLLHTPTKTTVRHGASLDASQVIGQYPTAVLLCFSRLANKNPSKSDLLVSGGTLDAVRIVMTWMIESCKRGHLIDYPMQHSPALVKLWLAFETTTALGIDYLNNQLRTRMIQILSKQAHDEDCRIVFTKFPPQHFLQAKIATSIGNATWEAYTLKASGKEELSKERFKVPYKYAKLRREIPTFDQAVSAVIEPMRKAYKEEQAKIEAEKMEMKAAKKKQKEAEYWKSRAAQHQREQMVTVKIPEGNKAKEAEINAWILANNKTAE